MQGTEKKNVDLNDVKFDNKLTIDIAEVCRQIFDDNLKKEKDNTDDTSSSDFSFLSLGSDFTISDVEDNETGEENIVVFNNKPNADAMDALLAQAGLAIKRKPLRRSLSGITIREGKATAAKSLKKMTASTSTNSLAAGVGGGAPQQRGEFGMLKRERSSETLGSLQARMSRAGVTMQRVSSQETLSAVDKKSSGEKVVHIKPQDHLMAIMNADGIKARVLRQDEVGPNYFLETTREHIAAFQKDLVQAVRTDDMAALRQMFMSGRSLQACNVHGESIIHLVCRRGSAEMLRFLITEASLSVNVRCENGRSALHDACWTGSPDFEKIKLLLADYPDLLYILDNRGFTPLNYVPQSSWITWRKFLDENKDMIRPRELMCARRSSS